jgi:hypothetical protein
MFRILLLAFVLAGSAAPVEHFPRSALDLHVQGHDGRMIGRITAVERDQYGEIVAVEIPGLEPPDAPDSALVAEDRSLERLIRLTRSGAASG